MDTQCINVDPSLSHPHLQLKQQGAQLGGGFVTVTN